MVVLEGDSRKKKKSLIEEYLKIPNERFSEQEEVLPSWLDS